MKQPLGGSVWKVVIHRKKPGVRQFSRGLRTFQTTSHIKRLLVLQTDSGWKGLSRSMIQEKLFVLCSSTPREPGSLDTA